MHYLSFINTYIIDLKQHFYSSYSRLLLKHVLEFKKVKTSKECYQMKNVPNLKEKIKIYCLNNLSSSDGFSFISLQSNYTIVDNQM